MGNSRSGEAAKKQDNEYERLCASAYKAGGSVRLLREGEGWGLLATLPHEDGKPGDAIGFVFDSIDELSQHASVALRWIDLHAQAQPEAVSSQEERRGE